MAEGDFNAAAIELKNALQQEPDSAEARFLLGQVHLRAGDGASAVKELRRAEDAGYDGDALALPMARALLLTGGGEQVLQRVPQDLALETDEERQLYAARGEALMGLGQLDEATVAFERALEGAGAPVPRARGGLARIAIHGGDYAAAEQHLAAAAAAEPEVSEWPALQGELLLRQGRFQDAKAKFERFAKDDVGYAAGQIGYVRALVGTGELEAAKTWVDELRKRAPQDPRVLVLSGLVALEEGDFQAARNAAEQVLARDAANERARFIAGVAAYRTGQYETAHRHLTQYLLSGNEKDERAILYLSAAKLRLGEASAAYDLLRRSPDLAARSVAASALLAQAAARTGDVATGLAMLERLAGAQGSEIPAPVPAGLIRAAAGDLTDGSVTDSLEPDPTLDAIAQRMVMEQIRAGQLDEALAGAQQLVAKYPDRSVGYILQGMVWLQKAGVGAADQYFRKAWEVEPGNMSAGLNLAQIELSNDQPAAAATVLTRVLEQNPSNLNALLMLAEVEGRLGNPDRREKLLRDAVAAAPNAEQPRTLLARHLLQRGRPVESLAVLRPSLDQGTAGPAMLETAAIAALMQNQPAQALQYLRPLQDGQANAVQPHFLAAQAHLALADPEAAQTDLDRALQVDPDHYESRRLLAAVLQRLEQFEASLEQISLAKQQRPTDPSLADLEVKAHLAADRFPAAIAAARQALELAPATARVVGLAQAYWSAGERDRALSTLRDWLAARPQDGAAALALASLSFQAGDTEAALQHFDTAARLQPDSPLVENDYAWALWQAGRRDEARERAERAFALAPQDARIKDTLGTILAETGDPERGLELLRAAAAALPEVPAVRYHLALAHARSGDTRQAEALLTALLDSGQVFEERPAAEALLKSLRQ